MNLAHSPIPAVPSGTSRLLRRLLKAPDGIETIEFALVSLVLLLFLLGVVEFGRLYWTQSELQYAAEAAARCATVTCCPGDAACGGNSGSTGVQSYAAGQLLGMVVPSGNLTNFTVSSATCGNQVSFQYTFDFIVVGSLFGQNAITLSTTACHQA